MGWPKSYSRDSVLSDMFWLYVFCKCFGFLPFSVAYDAERKLSKVRVTVIDLLWSILAILVHASFHIYYLLAKMNEISASFVSYFVSVLLMIVSGALIITSFVMDVMYRNDIGKIVNYFDAFDQKVIQLLSIYLF